MVTVTVWAGWGARRGPVVFPDNVFPHPSQPESSRSPDRSALWARWRIGGAEHATAKAPGSTTFLPSQPAPGGGLPNRRLPGRGAGVASAGSKGRGTMSEARRFVGTVLLLASTAAPAADGDRTAVIAVGKCDEASGIAARSFRSALAAKPDAKVASEAETAQPFGGTTDRSLATVTSAISSARSDFYAGQAAQAKTTLQGALDDVARLAPSEARWAAERDALTLLAQVQQKSDPKAAEAALNRVFRVEPDYQPDTSNYPPSFQKYVNGVRKGAKKKSTSRLDVTTSPAGKPVYIGGRKVGVGPVSVRVPPGEYRVEADWGHRAAVRTVTVPGAPVELSAAVEGAIFPDGGPCVEAADASAALARAVRLTGTSRIIGVHQESAGDDNFVVVTSANAQGQDVREARVKVQPGAPSTEALGLLADWAANGKADPP